MCVHHQFSVRDNVATFSGVAEMFCLSGMGINPLADDVNDRLKRHVTEMVVGHLRDQGFQTGEGLVTVRREDVVLHVRATVGAHGPDMDLRHHFYDWRVIPTRSASG